MLEYDRTVTNIYMDLTHIPLLFNTTLDAKHNAYLAKNSFGETALNWKRAVNFNSTTNFQTNSKRPFSVKDDVDDFLVSNNLDSFLLGMAKTVCLQLSPNIAILDKLLLMANACKELNKNFFFYVADIRFRKSTINFAQVRTMLDEKSFPFGVYYACLALFSNSYKVHTI